MGAGEAQPRSRGKRGKKASEKEREKEKSERPRTPWHPSGAPGSLSLGGELRAFADLMALGPEETAARDAAFATAKDLLRRHQPAATATVVGCHAYGISAPTSELAILVEHCSADFVSEAAVEGLFCAMGESVAATEGDMVVVEVAAKGVAVVITVTAGSCEEAHARVAEARRWVSEYPASLVVVSIIRHVLAQACKDLIVAKKGGLDPLAILAMVVHVCRSCLVPTEPGDLLLSYFDLYGKQLDYATQFVSPEKPSPQPRSQSKVGSGDLLCVIVSICGTVVNLAKGCTRLRQIKAHIQSCHIALRQFDPRRDSHTALSTIVSHQPLWQRVGDDESLSDLKRFSGYSVGEEVEALRSDGSWALCKVTGVDKVARRVTIVGDGFSKRVDALKLRKPRRQKPQPPQPQPQPQPQPLLSLAPSTVTTSFPTSEASSALWSFGTSNTVCTSFDDDADDLDIDALTHSLRNMLE